MYWSMPGLKSFKHESCHGGPRSGKTRLAFDGQGSAADTKNAVPCMGGCVRYDRYGVTPCHVTFMREATEESDEAQTRRRR
jgi:hypothetical protein